MKIQLKRSNVLESGAAKEPTAAQMEYGELAVNYSNADPAIFIKDAADNIIRIGGVGSISDDGQVEVPSSSNPPATPEDGNLWYNPEDGRLYVYYNDGNSSQWVDASPDGWNAAEDGASIHVGDTPPASPLEGSLWWNTTDNTLYIYYIDATSEQWVTASPSGSIDVDDFVAIAGDNMTGNLTLGTDKITLDASDGSATFDGNVQVGGNPLTGAGNNVGVVALPKGTFVLVNDSVDGSGVNDPCLLIKSPTAGVTQSRLNNDGSAEFAGDVQVGGDTASSDGVLIRDLGLVKAARSRAIDTLFAGYTTGVTSATSEIKADGSVLFRGRATIGDYNSSKGNLLYADGGVVARRSDDSQRLFVGLDGATETFSVSRDGSAEFSGGKFKIDERGTVTRPGSGGDYYSLGAFNNSGATTGATGGRLVLKTDESGSVDTETIVLNGQSGSAKFAGIVEGSRFINDTGSADPWLKGVNSSGTETFNVNKSGSAMFAGNITTGGYDITDGSKRGLELRPDGLVRAQRPGSAGSSAVWQGYNGTEVTSTIRSEGSAEFAGDKIKLNFDGTADFYRASTNTTDDLCSWSSNVGSTKAIQIRFKADGTISGKNVTFDLEADDDTKYTTTTDSEGVETRVYNGTTLDVKDRLQKADAALQSLKTAVANATDFTALKIAMTAALADI